FKVYLEELPLKLLLKIATSLNISSTVDLNVPNAIDILETISTIAENCNFSFLNSNIEDYKRISTPKKIHINKLEERKEEIDSILERATVVDNVIKEMNQDIKQFSKFEVTRQYIINLYQQLSKNYSGVELYDLMISETLESHKCKKALEMPLKFLVVYIFDKCDIFEKE
ncbi:MAG: hypothetical protein RSF67_07275, partial [Clostridia bacterium]